MELLLLLFALLGHAFLWVGLVNQLHAVNIRRRIISILTAAGFTCMGLIPVGMGWQYASQGQLGFAARLYVMACCLVAAATLLRLVYLRVICRPPAIVRFRGTQRVAIDTASAAVHPKETVHHFLARFPYNEILQLDVTRWVLDVPRLPPALDGLTIVHLSDLHFTGRVGKAFFREVVRASNELQPDLVCLTGDIVDKPIGLEWIADTVGQLSARHGVYFILGNHDRRVDSSRLRQTLISSGLVDLGGRWLPIEIRGTPVLLAGNERPWFGGPSTPSNKLLPPSQQAACGFAGIANRQQLLGSRTSGQAARPDDGRERFPNQGAAEPLTIVLAHSPDQFAWARAHHADLMLAGHTHGGQIRIPPLGAIVSPTLHGVKYISGIYHVAPTILHVTRGLSGDIPIRWNCRPEIAHLQLRAKRQCNV